MRIKNKNLEWNVLMADFNTKKIKNYNVLSYELVDRLHTKIVKKKEITNYEELKEDVRRWCMYYYWSKTECEIAVGNLFAKYPDEFEKIDAFRQIEMNLDRMCEYIIRKLDIKF